MFSTRPRGLRGLLLCVLSPVVLLAGCGAGVRAVSAPVGAESGYTLTGAVHGGQQAVAGASLQLYAAGTTGKGMGATALLKTPVATAGDGSFGITGDYQCPSATTPVYMVARGGNPGLQGVVSNPALVLMTALGPCGGLSSASFISIDEVTTVAAAWALAPFAGAGGNVGATSTNSVGLTNAFASALNLASSSTGVAPGAALPNGATTETAKLNTLADVLATCVNSDGGFACKPLFAAATHGGVAPANTLDAALAVVRNPLTAVTDVFYAAPANGPFQPVLARAPTDWTMSVTFGDCASGCGGLDYPTSLAVDSTGSVWVANYGGGVVSKFAPGGQAVAGQGFPGTGLRESYGLAVDGQDNVWVANEESNYATGSIVKLNSGGQLLSGNGFVAGGIYYPVAIAADPNGTMWVANYITSTGTLLANDGSSLSGTAGYGGSALAFPTAVAVDGGHAAWYASQGSVTRIAADGTNKTFACGNEPDGIAFDPWGNAWVVDFQGGGLYELNAAGTIVHSSAGTLTAPVGVAVDSAGTVYAASFHGNALGMFTGAQSASPATALSGTAGFGLDAGLLQPYGVALDASGSLWVTNLGSSTLTQFVGLAAPVRTPLLGLPVAP